MPFAFLKVMNRIYQSSVAQNVEVLQGLLQTSGMTVDDLVEAVFYLFRQGYFESDQLSVEPVTETLAALDPEVVLNYTNRQGVEALQKLYAFDDKAETNPGKIAAYLQEYQPHVEAAARKHGVDTKWIYAIIINESGGNPVATSPTGAKGLMQLTKYIAGAKKVFGKNINPYSVKDNIDRGTAFLAELDKKYHGDLQKIFAAYNQGEPAVDKAIKASHKSGKNWRSHFQNPEGQKFINTLTNILNLNDGRLNGFTKALIKPRFGA